MCILMATFVEQVYDTCINTLQFLVFTCRKRHTFRTFLTTCGGEIVHVPKPTSRGSSKSVNDTRNLPPTHSPWIRPSVSLPRSREMESVHCWKLPARSRLLNGPNHPGHTLTSTICRRPSAHGPFQAGPACVIHTDALCRVHPVRILNSEKDKIYFPHSFLEQNIKRAQFLYL